MVEIDSFVGLDYIKNRTVASITRFLHRESSFGQSNFKIQVG